MHHDEDKDETDPADSSPGTAPLCEIRSYELPHYILRDERELLTITDSAELPDVLNKIHDHFACVVGLMKHFNQEENVCDIDLNNIAELLSPSFDWLERLCDTFSGFQLVRRMKTE